MTDPTTPDLDAIRARAEAATELWAWHEATDDTLAGWGAHMGQMLYRLPRDRQTDDMRDSILAMVADIPALLAALDEAKAEVQRLREERDEWRRVAAEQTRMERDRAEAAEARATALETTLATVRAEHTRDRERLAKIEALVAGMDCEWGTGRDCHGPTCCRRAALRAALATEVD